MKNEFEHLIKEIEGRLVPVDYKSDSFVDVACDILRETPFSPNLSHLSEAWCWLSSRQQFPRGEFSWFPLTLFSWEHFHLDLYVWRNESTSIHDHHFHGAFKVIQGDYFQTIFSFDGSTQLSPGVKRGKLQLIDRKNLPPQSVQSIYAGERFIHSVTHSEKINMTLCLRTKDFQESLNQYLLPGLKITYAPIPLLMQRQLDALWLQVIELGISPAWPGTFSVPQVFRYLDQKAKSSGELQRWRDYLVKSDVSFDWDEIFKAFHKTKLLLNY